MYNILLKRNKNSETDKYAKNAHYSFEEKEFHKTGVPKNVRYSCREEKSFIWKGKTQQKNGQYSSKKVKKVLQGRDPESEHYSWERKEKIL